jgi:hypothetical protein
MSLLSGFHKHHIIPRYKGGNNSPENLVVLHPIDHAIAHLVRYKMYGDIRDKWASNWLQNIVDPDVYTEYSIAREKGIKEKRSINPDFDAHMRSVRSKASKNRNEGYQKRIGEIFKLRMNKDIEFACRIRKNRQNAKIESVKSIYKRDEERVRKVRQMRMDGFQYKEISKETGFFISVISGILNGKQYVDVGRIS